MAWREIDWTECRECGCELYAITKAPDGLFFDGDIVRCVECGRVGSLSLDSETPASVMWASDDDPPPERISFYCIECGNMLAYVFARSKAPLFSLMCDNELCTADGLHVAHSDHYEKPIKQ